MLAIQLETMQLVGLYELFKDLSFTCYSNSETYDSMNHWSELWV